MSAGKCLGARQHYVVNHYNELKVFLCEQKDLKEIFPLFSGVFNDGLGFRYEFPEQDNLKDVIIVDENTQYNLTGNHMCWWQPGDWDIYEHPI